MITDGEIDLTMDRVFGNNIAHKTLEAGNNKYEIFGFKLPNFLSNQIQLFSNVLTKEEYDFNKNIEFLKLDIPVFDKNIRESIKSYLLNEHHCDRCGKKLNILDKLSWKYNSEPTLCKQCDDDMSNNICLKFKDILDTNYSYKNTNKINL